VTANDVTIFINHDSLGGATADIDARIYFQRDSSICSTKASILVIVCSSE
jgi:hypothetical protein